MQELELKRAEQKQQADMLASMHSMQMNFMQANQAQNQLLINLFSKVLPQ